MFCTFKCEISRSKELQLDRLSENCHSLPNDMVKWVAVLVAHLKLFTRPSFLAGLPDCTLAGSSL